MPLRCQIDRFPEKGATVLRVHGDLDFDLRVKFEEALTGLLHDSAPQLILDLGQVTRMSSVFIAAFIAAAEEARSSEQILTCRLPARLARTCRDAGLENYAKIIEA